MDPVTRRETRLMVANFQLAALVGAFDERDALQLSREDQRRMAQQALGFADALLEAAEASDTKAP